MSTSLKRAFFVVTGLILMMVISACGGTSSTGSTSTPTTAPSAPTATPVPATIQTAQATVEVKRRPFSPMRTA